MSLSMKTVLNGINHSRLAFSAKIIWFEPLCEFWALRIPIGVFLHLYEDKSAYTTLFTCNFY